MEGKERAGKERGWKGRYVLHPTPYVRTSD